MILIFFIIDKLEDVPFEEEEIEDNLGDIMEMLRGLDMKRWRTIATRIRLRSTAMDTIETYYSKDVERCLEVAITEWLNMNYDDIRRFNGRPSWRRLADVVYPLDRTIFEKIVKKHPAGMNNTNSSVALNYYLGKVFLLTD